MRNSLIKTWETIKNKLYQKTPMWITPIEAFKHPNLIDWHQIKTYKDLIGIDGKIKTVQELEETGIKLSW